MNKGNLELQIQQQTQKDIANLKHDIGELIKAYTGVDMNMRQAYAMMVSEMNKLTIRINFLIEQATKNYGNKEEFEALYKVFEKEQTEKMQTQIAEIIKKQQEEKETGENNGSKQSSIIQG